MATRVVIAGGGVAALEAALALRALAEERVEVELIAPEPHFWYRPLSVAEPFELGETHHYELAALAAAAGATFTLGTLQGVDARPRGEDLVGAIPYDVLLVAVGAVPTEAVPRRPDVPRAGGHRQDPPLLEEIAAGDVGRVAFAVPWGAVWSLPIYELALMTAAHLGAHQIQGVELSLVTPEEEPLQLFGPAGSDAVAELLDERGITLVARFPSGRVRGRRTAARARGPVEVDRVVALPRLRGPRLDGLPQTLDGFIPIDAHGRVHGLDDVYAAGDITNFPVKQGGIATQLADAAAERLPQAAGADLTPEPFQPVLRGLLLTGGRPRYLRHELTGRRPGRYSQPGSALVAAGEDRRPPSRTLPRRTSPASRAHPSRGLHRARSGSRSTSPRESSISLRPTARREGRARATRVGEVMSADPLVVSPEEMLGEVAQTMRDRDTGSAAVALHGRLIGILTSRDLLRAFAARVHPSEARVREWMTAEPVAVPASTSVEAAVS